jgi:hypothetical protein
MFTATVVTTIGFPVVSQLLLASALALELAASLTYSLAMNLDMSFRRMN